MVLVEESEFGNEYVKTEFLFFLFSSGDNVQSKTMSDVGPRSASQSPQSVGSSGVDSGAESTSDGIRDLPSIAISLCGGLTDSKEITKGTE